MCPVHCTWRWCKWGTASYNVFAKIGNIFIVDVKICSIYFFQRLWSAKITKKKIQKRPTKKILSNSQRRKKIQFLHPEFPKYSYCFFQNLTLDWWEVKRRKPWESPFPLLRPRRLEYNSKTFYVATLWFIQWCSADISLPRFGGRPLFLNIFPM